MWLHVAATRLCVVACGSLQLHATHMAAHGCPWLRVDAWVFVFERIVVCDSVWLSVACGFVCGCLRLRVETTTAVLRS